MDKKKGGGKNINVGRGKTERKKWARKDSLLLSKAPFHYWNIIIFSGATVDVEPRSPTC